MVLWNQDPIRDDVNEAVATCLKAGIDIKLLQATLMELLLKLLKK